MNAFGRVVHLDAKTHRSVQALLPWYAREALDEAERQRVETHLAACAHCQAELDWERRLQAAHAELPAAAGDVEAGLAALHARLDAGPDRLAAWRARLARWGAAWRTGPPVWRWALAVQAVLIVCLAATLLRPSDAPTYRALGNASHGVVAGDALVMFDADLSEARLRALLQESGARVVDGPTVAGAYVVRLSDPQALARLQGQPGVRMAQALTPPAP
ncbi:zf-HC2 domain-containing protein [Niveibacterium sp. SC-1]|uniref:zf-HC2 domain-containing protein n=1 Tax=Niveibacterium sp. SC-1 TaxID=3135646 RepID=UPI00311F971F